MHCNNVNCTNRGKTVVGSSTCDSGGGGSIAIGTDGFPVISCSEGRGSGQLEYVRCHDLTCSSASVAVVDTLDWPGQYTSIAIGSDGLPLISYTREHDTGGFDLRVAHCGDLDCSAPTITTLDSFYDVGRYLSMTIGADGLAVISYHDATNQTLKVAECQDVACTGATGGPADSNGQVGEYSSIAIGTYGRPAISYYDSGNGNLKVLTHYTMTTSPLASMTQHPKSADLQWQPSTIHSPAPLVAESGTARDGLVAHELPVGHDGNIYATSFRPSAAELARLLPVREPVETGDVVVIDRDSPGVLGLARFEHDKTVFGIVAADPGLLLGSVVGAGEHRTSQETDLFFEEQPSPEASADGESLTRAPVVVSGVALCKVDADYGSIEVGDLLTTSLTPGHAMRADEPRPGTILGKALEPLDYGTGLIKVLVMLR
jgi:hypothetical protein